MAGVPNRDEKSIVYILWPGGPRPVPQLVRQTGMNGFEKNWRQWMAVHTEDRRAFAGLDAPGSGAQW